jgi:hypothetical protein
MTTPTIVAASRRWLTLYRYHRRLLKEGRVDRARQIAALLKLDPMRRHDD